MLGMHLFERITSKLTYLLNTDTSCFSFSAYIAGLHACVSSETC